MKKIEEYYKSITEISENEHIDKVEMPEEFFDRFPDISIDEMNQMIEKYPNDFFVNFIIGGELEYIKKNEESKQKISRDKKQAAMNSFIEYIDTLTNDEFDDSSLTEHLDNWVNNKNHIL